MQAEEIERSDLRDEGLGRGDSDLRTGVGVDYSVGLARNRRALGVADGERPGACGDGVLDRHEGVHGLAGLADGHHERSIVDHRIAVAELVRQIDLDGNPGPLLDRVLAKHPGVAGRPTAKDDDAVDVFQHVVAEDVEFAEPDRPALDPAEQRLRDGFWLLADLLGHEARPAALFRCRSVPGDLELLRIDRVSVEIGDRHGIRRDGHDLILADRDGATGVLDEGRDIRPKEVFSIPKPDHERRVAASADHDARLVFVQDQQGECAVQSGHDVAERQCEVARLLVLEPDEQGGDLGVGLAREDGVRVLSDELRSEIGEVLNDAVMDERELAVVTEVRMRVLVVRATVGCPACVTDAGRTVGQVVRFEVVDEDLQFARPLAGVQFTLGVDHGDSRRVVTAILEPTQSAEKHLDAPVAPDITHDSAHGTRFYGTAGGDPPSTGFVSGHRRLR